MNFEINGDGSVTADPHVFRINGDNLRGRATFRVHADERRLELVRLSVNEGIEIYPTLSETQRLRIGVIIGRRYPWA